jgi:hypothetical protein
MEKTTLPACLPVLCKYFHYNQKSGKQEGENYFDTPSYAVCVCKRSTQAHKNNNQNY